MYSNYQQAPTGGGLAIAGVLTAAVETAVMVSPLGAPLPPSPQGVVIRGRINATGGATGGGWSIRCRRGSGTGGAQVGPTITFTYPATTTSEIPFSFNDLTPPASGQYTITVAAAGSNGTFNDGAIEVYVPEPAGSDT